MMRLFLKRKRASTQLLEVIIELIPKIIIFLILLGILSIIYQLFIDKPEYSSMETNYNLVSKELKNINEGERMNVPVLGGDSRYVLYSGKEGMETSCGTKPCFCIYWSSKDKPQSRCDTFDKLKLQNSCTLSAKDTKYITLKKENEKILFEGTC